MSPRIAPVEQPDAEQRAMLERTPPAPDGSWLNLFATLAHRPQLLRRINGLGGYFVLHGTIPARERELVVLRTAAAAGSAYVEAQHRMIGAQAGLAPAEIEAALDPRSPHGWSPEDRALLAATDELIATGRVSAPAWDALPGWLDDSGRLELPALIGFYRLVGGLLTTLEIELDASVPGVPEPQAPPLAQPDVSFARLEPVSGERFQQLRRQLGLTGFRMNLMTLEAGQRGRIHAHERQEEAYVVLEGELTLLVEGARHVLGPWQLARVGPAVRRQVANGGAGRVVVLALGGIGGDPGRDARAWASWDEPGGGRPPQDVPLPEDLPAR